MQISLKRYDELVESEAILHALQAAGVDNWEGYSEAMEELEKKYKVTEVSTETE